MVGTERSLVWFAGRGHQREKLLVQASTDIKFKMVQVVWDGLINGFPRIPPVVVISASYEAMLI